MLLNRFIYEVDANEGNGGGAAPETIQLTADELKGYGFESRESLTNFLAQQKEANKPDAEKQKAIETDRANFLKFSVDNDLLKLDEYNQYESIKGKAAHDLVYDKFVSEFKEDNPELTAEEIAEEAKTAFENEYKLNSANEKIKARGEARLNKEAGEIKNPFDQKYNTAKEKYDTDKTVRAKYPEYTKFMDDIIEKNTPEKLVVKVKDGKEEIDVDVPLTKEQKAEVEKLMKNAKTFSAFMDGKDIKGLEEQVSKKIQGYLKVNNFEKVAESSYQKGHGIGLAKGSNVGANNPFGMRQGQGQDNGGATIISLEESNAKVQAAREKARQAR